MDRIKELRQLLLKKQDEKIELLKKCKEVNKNHSSNDYLLKKCLEEVLVLSDDQTELFNELIELLSSHEND